MPIPNQPVNCSSLYYHNSCAVHECLLTSRTLVSLSRARQKNHVTPLGCTSQSVHCDIGLLSQASVTGEAITTNIHRACSYEPDASAE